MTDPNYRIILSFQALHLKKYTHKKLFSLATQYILTSNLHWWWMIKSYDSIEFGHFIPWSSK